MSSSVLCVVSSPQKEKLRGKIAPCGHFHPRTLSQAEKSCFSVAVLARELEADDLAWVKLAAVGREERAALPDVHDAVVDAVVADLADGGDSQVNRVVQIVLDVPLEILVRLGEPLEPDMQVFAFDPCPFDFPSVEVILVAVLDLQLASLVLLENLSRELHRRSLSWLAPR